jgi:hypothetical protein
MSITEGRCSCLRQWGSGEGSLVARAWVHGMPSHDIPLRKNVISAL